MQNIKLTIAYDGTDFSGWQVQRGQPTIQGALSEVLENLTRQNLLIQGAGRTDAGVHAAGQVANFQTEAELTADEFQRAFNALLPGSIRIVDVEEAASDFHARWNCDQKCEERKDNRGERRLAAHEHVMAPNQEPDQCNRDAGKGNGFVSEDRFL